MGLFSACLCVLINSQFPRKAGNPAWEYSSTLSRLSAILRKSAEVIGRLPYVREYLTIIGRHVSTAAGRITADNQGFKPPSRAIRGGQPYRVPRAWFPPWPCRRRSSWCGCPRGVYWGVSKV